LRAVLGFARRGDVIVVHTLDRLGRTVRDTLNLIHELTERGVGVRNLADPIKVDSADSADAMGQLAVVLLALFAHMERTYTCERAAHARAVAAAHGRQVGRPSLLDPAVLAYGVHLRDAGHTMAQIVVKTGMTRSSLYRYLPPRPSVAVTTAERRGCDGGAGRHCYCRRGGGGRLVTADGVGERLVTVLLTLAVPEVADPEDAAALVADAAATSALEVRHAVGVEGHLPAPGATVVRPGRRQPWQVVAVTVDTLRLRDLTGDIVEVSRRSVRPDPLDVPAALGA